MARTGRPKLEDSRSHKISVRFSDEQLARLEALSFPIFLRNSFWTKIKNAKTLYQCYN